MLLAALKTVKRKLPTSSGMLALPAMPALVYILPFLLSVSESGILRQLFEVMWCAGTKAAWTWTSAPMPLLLVCPWLVKSSLTRDSILCSAWMTTNLATLMCSRGCGATQYALPRPFSGLWLCAGCQGMGGNNRNSILACNPNLVRSIVFLSTSMPRVRARACWQHMHVHGLPTQIVDCDDCDEQSFMSFSELLEKLRALFILCMIGNFKGLVRACIWLAVVPVGPCMDGMGPQQQHLMGFRDRAGCSDVQVMGVIINEALPLLYSNAMAGHVDFSTRDCVFEHRANATSMFIDVLTDRGFKVSYKRIDDGGEAVRVDTQTGAVHRSFSRPVHSFRISFPGGNVRESLANTGYVPLAERRCVSS